jgi:hypothetical protein
MNDPQPWTSILCWDVMFLDHHVVVVVVVVKEEEVERYYGADVRCIVSFALQHIKY